MYHFLAKYVEILCVLNDDRKWKWPWSIRFVRPFRVNVLQLTARNRNWNWKWKIKWNEMEWNASDHRMSRKTSDKFKWFNAHHHRSLNDPENVCTAHIFSRLRISTNISGTFFSLHFFAFQAVKCETSIYISISISWNRNWWSNRFLFVYFVWGTETTNPIDKLASNWWSFIISEFHNVIKLYCINRVSCFNGERRAARGG